MGAALLLLLTCVLGLAACGESEPAATPLPTRDGTIGRAHDGLKKADDEAARRRAQIDEAGK